MLCRLFKIDKTQLPFDSKQMLWLLLPVMLEQLLNSFMGMADTMMVSRVGASAISAVSLVDSINLLVIQVFAALATGAAIICSHYVGRKDAKAASNAAGQVTLTVLFISLTITMLCMVFAVPLLNGVFGEVEADVMSNSYIYFMITAVSFPFIALFGAGSAFFRACGNSRFPMLVSIISNFINIAGNALLIFGFNMGVAGAALATLISRAFCAAAVFIFLRKERQMIVLKKYFAIRPELDIIAKILAVGIPSGIENGMFQFGKLAIQSSVSTLGTTAIAAQAMTIIFENVNGMAGVGIGIGLMTMVGQCMGAGKKDMAKYYIVKVTIWGWIAILLSCLFVYAIAGPVTVMAGMEPESAALCLEMIFWITVFKPIFWTTSFVPVYGLRAAGDVKFSMITATLTMWLCRVMLATVLIRAAGFGPIAVWIGMFADWAIRSVIFAARFVSMKWSCIKVV